MLPPPPAVTPLPPPDQPAGPPPAPTPGPRQFSVAPRGGQGFDIKGEPLADGTQAVIVTGGVILSVANVPGVGLHDLEADRLVLWSKGGDAQQLISNIQTSQGQSTNQLEFYLAGNVEIRQSQDGEMRILRADEVYYDVNHNVAVALSALLQLKKPGVPTDIYVKSDELLELSATKYQVVRSDIFSSKLPSDPGLQVYTATAVIEDKTSPKFSIFGTAVVNPKTGRQENQTQTLVEARDVFFELQGVPFFYTPYLAGDAREPLGPVREIDFGYNKVFGVQLGVGLNVYDLLGLDAYEGTSWKANFDYLTQARPQPRHGVRLLARTKFFGIPSHNEGVVKGLRPCTTTPRTSWAATARTFPAPSSRRTSAAGSWPSRTSGTSAGRLLLPGPAVRPQAIRTSWNSTIPERVPERPRTRRRSCTSNSRPSTRTGRGRRRSSRAWPPG